ncbi:MAG: hypothetical protein SOV72_04575 [Candidatus Enteromonas sp.]|nr:hypothetical protein [Candidatus Enteromonas sp.]
MKKQTILMCALGVAAVAATAVGTGYSVSSKSGVFFAGGDDGVWKHYARKEATKTEKGIREYWVNCLTNEHVFTAPTTGTIEEGGAYKTEGFTETDDRWIYPATLTAQDVVMTEATKTLDLGTYAGGTVSYIKAGTFNLGTDPENLDVSGFKADHTDDGVKTVEIGTIKDGKEYALTCETTFVTAMIKTADDFKEYVYPKVDADQFGYFKLENDVNVQNLISTWNETWYGNNARNHSFGGTFDGNGKKLVAKSSGICGAFGSLKKATVKNVTITDGWYNGDKNASLIAAKILETTFENVNTVITGGKEDFKATGTGTPKCHAPIPGEGATGYLANTTFQANTLKNCTFDASGWKLGSLFGWNQSMTTPTVTNSVVKAASLVQAMHSLYYEGQGKTATFQPEGVELKEGEAAIKGLTFVTA